MRTRFVKCQWAEAPAAVFLGKELWLRGRGCTLRCVSGVGAGRGHCVDLSWLRPLIAHGGLLALWTLSDLSEVFWGA